MEDETLAEKIAQDVFSHIKVRLEEIDGARNSWWGKKEDNDLLVNKYTILEAETQYKNVREALITAGFIEKEENPQEKKADEKSNKSLDESAPMMETT